MLLAAQKGFASLLIVLTLTVLAIGGTAFLISVTYPNLFKNSPKQLQTLTSKINPAKIENTSSKYPTPTPVPTKSEPVKSRPTTSTSNPQTNTTKPSKNAFQLLKDKILPPNPTPTPIKSGPTAFPTNIDTSKEVNRYGSPTSTPASSSKPVNPDEDIPIYYK